MAVITKQTQNESISVDMGEIKTAAKLTDSLTAHGLGACIALCMFDTKTHVIGLAHIVLPRFQPSPPSRNKKEFPAKFAESATSNLIEEMCRAGAHRASLVAAIAGGSHIFGGFERSSPLAPRLEIGLRNAKVIIETLAAESIPLLAHDIGGNHGRTISIRANDGSVSVQPIGGEEWRLICLSKATTGALNGANSI